MLLLIEGFILSPMNNEQLRISLMVDYVDWVDRDYADISASIFDSIIITSKGGVIALEIKELKRLTFTKYIIFFHYE
jgi:hypothetical protein